MISNDYYDSEKISFSEIFTPARMKEQERFLACTQKAIEHSHITIDDISSSLSSDMLVKETENRKRRFLDRLQALDTRESDSPTPSHNPAILALYDACRERNIPLTATVVRKIHRFVQQEKEIYSIAAPRHFQKEMQDLLNTVSALINQHKEEKNFSVETLEDRNKKDLIHLRRICSSSIYAGLKHMEDHPFVRFIHTIILDQYLTNDITDIMTKMCRTFHLPEESLAERIRLTAVKLFDSHIDNKIIHTIRHFKLSRIFSTVLPFIAFKVAEFFSFHWLARFFGDERLSQRNTPTILDNHKFECLGMRATARTVALSAPAIGNSATPEFRAALQALENAQYGHGGEAMLWTYTNLQNMKFRPERPSSETLMQLQEDFPLSFSAVTLPQALRPAPSIGFSTKDVEYHLSLLLEPPQKGPLFGNRSGYAFPKAFLQTQAGAIKAIAYRAFEFLTTQSATHNDTTLKTAFIHLFHIGLIRLHEISAATLTARRIHRPSIEIIQSAVCASCLDRGGEMNAALLCANNPSFNNQQRAIDIYFGRALLTHRRAPTKFSINQLASLYDALSPEQLFQFVREIRPAPIDS